jgi:hypothetical protein
MVGETTYASAGRHAGFSPYRTTGSPINGELIMKKFVLAAATALTLAASLGAASAQSSMSFPGQIAPDRPGEFFSDAYRSGMKIGG